MTLSLPEKLAAYFAAVNRRDVDGMLSCFAEDALVRDEGEDMRGRAEIRAWIEKTTEKYGITAEIEGMEAHGDAIKIAARVSGTFPGSPITLNYNFTLGAREIVGLEIGL
jgi:ketosteroid isomerase-like protein